MALAENLSLHIQTHVAHLQTIVSTDVPSGLPAQLAELSAILGTYDTARASIDPNPRLSPEGKFLEAQAACNTAQGDIEKWRAGKIGGLDRQLAAARAALLAKAGQSVPEPTPLRVQTMIQRLADFDQLEVAVVYANA